MAIPSHPTDVFITQNHAGEIAGVHAKTIRAWIKAGELRKRDADSKVLQAEVLGVAGLRFPKNVDNSAKKARTRKGK